MASKQTRQSGTFRENEGVTFCSTGWLPVSF
jgi:hypothetical protein